MKSALWPAALAAALLIPAPPPAPAGFDLRGFARLPALEAGRVKPLETVARSALLSIRGRESVVTPSGELGPLPWLLDVLARPEEADAYPVFAIDDPDLLGLMGRPQASQRYFSLHELGPHVMEVVLNARRAQALDASRRSSFDAASINLVERVMLYQRLKREFEPQGADLRLVPPPAGGAEGDWKTAGEALSAAGGVDEAAADYVRLARAWSLRDAPSFNAAVSDLEAVSLRRVPAAAQRASWEALFDRAEPFYRGLVVYLAAFLLLLAALFFKPALLRRWAYALALAAFIVHTAGLAARMLLQGRPPVTNLYSSAIFVGWAAVLVGLWLERRFRGGLGLLAASAVGFSTLIIAHQLASQGDTIEMMRAVLDSNFWLSTHVVTITLGYSAMFLASALAHVYLGGRLWDPARAPNRELASMIYGVACLALLFSFVGTVLGGIWADQSWGRFWGWDPKENGALLIVLWTAIVLHARFGGYVREDGLAVMAVFGGIVTSLSWFGVNMLGVGLHSYGFMDRALPWLERFIFIELAVMTAPLLCAPRSKAVAPSAEKELHYTDV